MNHIAANLGITVPSLRVSSALLRMDQALPPPRRCLSCDDRVGDNHVHTKLGPVVDVDCSTSKGYYHHSPSDDETASMSSSSSSSSLSLYDDDEEGSSSLNDSCTSTSSTLSVSFAENLVTQIYEIPCISDKDRSLLFYTQDEMYYFKERNRRRSSSSPTSTTRGRRIARRRRDGSTKLIRFVEGYVTDVHHVPRITDTEECDALFYSEKELQRFLEEFFEALDNNNGVLPDDDDEEEEEKS